MFLKGNKKFWFIVVGGSFSFLLVSYLLNNHSISWKLPLDIFEPVVPKSLSKYPVIDDCQQRKYGGHSYDELSPEELEAIIKHATLLEQLTLRKGFSLGRVRVEVVFLPGASSCTKHFRLGVRKDNSSIVLEGEDQLQAFIVKEEQLPVVGQLLYGEPNKTDYKKKYSDWISLKPCISDSDRIGCVSYSSTFPLSIEDGQITQDSERVKILHRFVVEGLSDRVMVHKKITVDPEGLVTVESEELLEYRTGILF